MSLIELTTKTIAKVGGLIIGYFLTAGIYYNIIDSFIDMLTSEGGAELLGFIAWVEPVFFYAYPAVIVFGILWTVAAFYMKLRERYYASEEVYYYGS